MHVNVIFGVCPRINGKVCMVEGVLAAGLAGANLPLNLRMLAADGHVRILL
jgi:hypothetical protein